MSLKMLVKNTLGVIRCTFAGVRRNKGIYIGRHVHITNGRNIELGRNVQIRPDVDLFAGNVFRIGSGCDIGTRNRITGNIIIEDKVLFGPDNYISSEDHCYENIHVAVMDQGTYSIKNNGHDELRIGEGSWIGTHVAIIGDVHIGKHCVIGANAVVTKDVPDYCMVVGVPSKIIKKYNVDTGKWEKFSEKMTEV